MSAAKNGFAKLPASCFVLVIFATPLSPVTHYSLVQNAWSNSRSLLTLTSQIRLLYRTSA